MLEVSLYILKTFYRLEREQWLSPENLEILQWKRLQKMLYHAYHHTPFYKKRFDDAGIRPENIKFLISPADIRKQGKENIFEARVTRASYVGELVDYQLDLKGSLLRAKGETANPLSEGTTIRIYIEPEQLSILKA